MLPEILSQVESVFQSVILILLRLNTHSDELKKRF